MTEWREFRAQPGPQAVVLASEADIPIYGGAAGGGKTWGLIAAAARHIDVPGYLACIFRRVAKDITVSGGLWDEACKMYEFLGGVARKSPQPVWTFPSGARIEFAHMETERDRYRFQGAQFAFIGWDQLEHFTAAQFWYLTSRNRTMCGVRPRQLANCNPDPDSFIRTELLDWYIDGDGYPIGERAGVLRWFVREEDVLHWGDSPAALKHAFPASRPQSIAFLPARLDDNAILERIDPDYRTKLMSMASVDRARLLDGNWNARDVDGKMFARSWFPIIARPSRHKIVARVRAWDCAWSEATVLAPNPDWTRGVLMSIDDDGVVYIEDVVSLRGRSLAVENLIVETAAHDGADVEVCIWQDPSAGKAEAATIVRKLVGFPVHVEIASKDKRTYARPWSSQAEAGNVQLVQASWNAAFLAEAEAFPSRSKDDQVDAASLGFMRLVALAPVGAALDFGLSRAKLNREFAQPTGDRHR